MNRRERYAVGSTPVFDDGDIIEIDTMYFGASEEEAEYIEGVVIGQVIDGFNNYSYIVDFGDANVFLGRKYRAELIQVCAIVKKESEHE